MIAALEILGRDDVVAADHGAAGLVILDARQAQPGGRIDDREIEADFVEPLVQHLRHHCGGAVERVLGLAIPEIGHRDAAPAALLGGHLQGVGRRAQRREKAVGRFVAGGLAHFLAENRGVFQPMAVAVDDRMFQLRADLLGALVSAHAFLPEGDGRAPSSAWKRRTATMPSQTPPGPVSPRFRQGSAGRSKA
jgi:hypothetical protein